VKKLIRLMAVPLALSLVAAACGGGDDDEGAEGTTKGVTERDSPRTLLGVSSG
jgi:ABC-type glycerol-3-phosphate transport system substrate-binding protein